MRQPAPKLLLTDVITDPKYHPALQGLEIEEGDVMDFLKCFDILLLNMGGVRIDDACEQVGIAKATFYFPRWRNLANLARKAIAANKMVEVENLQNRVLDKAPALIDSLVSVGLNATRELDRVKAVELLYEMFPSIAGKQIEDSALPQGEYLKRPKNFNPMTPLTINVEPGATVTIANQSQDVIDVTPSEDDMPDTTRHS
jgi:hypothetical protein